jgi:hypothetical protein
MGALEKSALECMLKGKWNSIHLTVGAVGIISITIIIAASIVLLITITELGNLGIAHGQVNSTSLTSEQSPSTTSSNQTAPSDLQSNNTITRLGLQSSDKTIELKLLADSLSERLNKSAAILELTSKLPEVKSTPYSNLISARMLIYQKEKWDNPFYQ